ncbi:F-box domain-containing protein [Mycena indigotica]|uniref:F-box domain-containing protein n=1 Tax=Mycena indigotica TaxID=2126181 RepID=A0A8H6T4S5_9AGAR|nr:F-box domain-containing protein [Mycena indigotica]KAF7310241.1 F-box domain-containing protein [Mycena indigotica]
MKALTQKLCNLLSTAPSTTVRLRWKNEHEAFGSFVAFLDKEDDGDDEPILSRQGHSQSQAYISALPTELLGHIFIEVCRAMVPNVLAFDPSHGYFGPHFWNFQCSYVCVHWRQVALSTPQLWAFIDFSTPRRTKLCFRRAKATPLVIACRILPYLVPRKRRHAKAALEGRLWLVLERGRKQVKEIRLRGSWIHTYVSYTLRHRSGFPLLTEMVLDIQMDNTYASKTQFPPQSPPTNPLLHTLDTGGNVGDIAQFGQTLCALRIAWDPNAEGDLLHVLSACSRLQTLTVHASSRHQSPPLRIPARPTLLPCLLSIDITEDGLAPSAAMLLLNNISLPRLASCRVKFRDNPPDAEHIRSILATHFHDAAPTAQTIIADPDAQYTLRFSLAFRFCASLDPALAGPRELALSWVRESRPSRDPTAQVAFAAAWSAVDTLSLSLGAEDHMAEGPRPWVHAKFAAVDDCVAHRGIGYGNRGLGATA